MALRLILVGAMALFSGTLQAADTAARLDWSQRISLGSCASARVDAVNVEVGDPVEPGQVLVALDPVPAEARLAHARAVLARAQPGLEARAIELEQAEELYDRTVLSDTELRQAEIVHAIALAAVNEAEADVAAAEAGLECRIVRSPVQGVVVMRNVEVGQPVVGRERAPTLVVVAQAKQMDAVTDVPLDVVETLTRESRVHVRVGDRRIAGAVALLGLEPTSETPLLYSVRVRFPVPDDRRLRAGMPAVIELP